MSMDRAGMIAHKRAPAWLQLERIRDTIATHLSEALGEPVKVRLKLWGPLDADGFHAGGTLRSYVRYQRMDMRHWADPGSYLVFHGTDADHGDLVMCRLSGYNKQLDQALLKAYLELQDQLELFLERWDLYTQEGILIF